MKHPDYLRHLVARKAHKPFSLSPEQKKTALVSANRLIASMIRLLPRVLRLLILLRARQLPNGVKVSPPIPFTG
jgi:hypothetical protein